jgi:hypothetical protein
MRSRLLVLLAVLLAGSFAAQAQIIHPTTGTVNRTVVGGEHYYDSGGAGGNYSNSENGVLVLCPVIVTEPVSLTVNSFAVEERNGNGCFDTVTIYDGSTTAAPIIHSGCGDYDDHCVGNASVCIQAGDVFTATAAGNGCLTIEFTSDSSITYPGWDMTVGEMESRAGIPMLGRSGIALLVLLMAVGAILIIRRRFV